LRVGTVVDALDVRDEYGFRVFAENNLAVGVAVKTCNFPADFVGQKTLAYDCGFDAVSAY